MKKKKELPYHVQVWADDYPNWQTIDVYKFKHQAKKEAREIEQRGKFKSRVVQLPDNKPLVKIYPCD